MATRKKKSETWPKITVGTHLTVTEFEDGSTVLAWDHDALQRECEAAIASVENKPKKKAKKNG